MKIEDCVFKLTFRAACLYEQMTGKSYFMMSATEEDIMKLTYCIIIANNERMQMGYNTFKVLMGDKKFAKFITNKYNEIAEIGQYFSKFDKIEKEDDEKEQAVEPEKPMTMTDVVASLIVQHHLEPHYVMNEMQMFEIQPYLQCAENIKKAELVEKRMWAYLQIAPHIDTKKCKSPEKLLPFAWEAKTRRKKQAEELKNNQYAIKNIIGKTFNWIK